MALTKEGKLEHCLADSNCILVEWEFPNLDKAFSKLIQFASQLPRTKVLEKNKYYWHGLSRSLIFRFPDDLEILKLSQDGIIQVKSSSRIGVNDFGVNANRIKTLHDSLLND